MVPSEVDSHPAGPEEAPKVVVRMDLAGEVVGIRSRRMERGRSQVRWGRAVGRSQGRGRDPGDREGDRMRLVGDTGRRERGCSNPRS